MERTRGWWLVRIELAIGVAAVGLGLLAYVQIPEVMFGAPSFRREPLILLGLLGLAAGLAWMVRVFRGSGEGPSSWRYRDR